MRVSLQTFWLPKYGNSREEYEDAFAPARDGSYDGDRLAFAVTDGASEGMLSGQWAQILAKAYCRETDASGLDELLVRAHDSWSRWRSHYLARRVRENRPLQWFEEPGFERGAFSTLLGLDLSGNARAGQWQGLAVGDSCLFQVRNDDLVHTFPIEEAALFGNRPFLIASNTRLNNHIDQHTFSSAGEWQSGDCFYLMTDALAHWFMRETEQSRMPWETLHAQLAQPDQLEGWITSLRQGQHMRNDDVTLLVVEIK